MQPASTQSKDEQVQGQARVSRQGTLLGRLEPWAKRVLFSSILAFSWGVEILLFAATANLLVQGKFDVTSLDIQKILIYLPVWTGWTILMTLVIRSSWPRRSK